MTLTTDSGQSCVGRSARPRIKRPDDRPNIIVPILRSGIVAREFCRHGAHAEVEAVFERSFYLRCGDMFVCVGEPAIGDGPLTLIAELGVSRALASLGLYPGQPAAISDRCIAIDDQVKLTFDRCVPWRQPQWPSSRSPRELNDLCCVIARRMVLESPPEGLGRVFCRPEAGAVETPLARVVRPRLARFESWLLGTVETDFVPITASPTPVTDLVGLGPGLTPSGDDVLIGALALLDALSETKAHVALARAVAAVPHGSTSALSECLLKTAAAGHLGADLCCAVSAVVAGAAEEAVAAIRKIGHSSGWDMMVGVLTTLRAVATRDAGESF